MTSPERTRFTLQRYDAVRCAGLAACLGLAASCGEVKLAEPKAPSLPTDQQAGSRAAPNPLEPLIIEWPASERAELEAQLKSGLVAVHYDGRAMDVLTQCRVAGSYAFRATNVHHDALVIENEDALATFLPLGVASLRGKLRQAGTLQVSMTVVGTWRTEPRRFLRDELEGDCRRATHVVASIAVGAFQINTGGSTNVGAGVMVQNVGAEGTHAVRKDTISKAGDETACDQPAAAPDSPPERCGALVRLGLVDIQRSRPKPAAEPAAAASALPPLPAASAAAPPPSATSSPSRAPPLFEPSNSPPFATSQLAEPSPPAKSGTSAWPYVLGGGALALLLGIAIAAAVTKKDPVHKDPPVGGLGNTTLSTGLRW
jgi:hypothetical protein